MVLAGAEAASLNVPVGAKRALPALRLQQLPLPSHEDMLRGEHCTHAW